MATMDTTSDQSAETFLSVVHDDSTQLREGYAKVGDMRLHYVEAGDGPLVVLLHGFPEFWYGWRDQIAPLAAAGYHVVAPDLRGYNLSPRARPGRPHPRLAANRAQALCSRPDRGRHPRPDPGAGGRVGDPRRPRLGRDGRLDDRHEPPGRRREARHPRCRPSSEALQEPL